MDDKKDNGDYKSPIYPFYYSRNDKRIFVPKLVGYGYTFNFGHWASWVIILVVVVLPLVLVHYLT